MSSPFYKVPHEVLDHIIGYLCNSERGLRQLQIATKRFQCIAEKYIYRRIGLIPHINTSKFAMEMTPQRCKLVKSLIMWRISSSPIPLNDDFFDRFCNIERMEVYFGTDWQEFNEIFTPEHCRLKELPYFSNEEDDLELYLEALQNHSRSLVELQHDEASVELLEKIGGLSLSFPQLTYFQINLPSSSSLQDVDTIVNNCPLLEKLYLTLSVEEKLTNWIPTVQHHRLMKKISLDIHFFIDYPVLFSYVTAKFPSVQEYYVSDFALYEPSTNFSCLLGNREDLIPFEKYAGFLHLFMKSMKVELIIFTPYSSYPAVDDFLKTYQFNTAKISVKYQSLNLSIDTTSMQEEEDLEVAKISIKYSPQQEALSNSAKIVIDKVKFFDSRDDIAI